MEELFSWEGQNEGVMRLTFMDIEHCIHIIDLYILYFMANKFELLKLLD